MRFKTFIFLLGVSFLIFSLAYGSKDEADMMEFAKKILKTLNSHDAAAVAKLYTEDAIYYEPNEPEPLKGREAIEKNYTAYFRAFPDFKAEFTLILTSGEYLILEGYWVGTNTGPMPSPEGEIPATGRSVKIKFLSLAKISPEGLTAEDRSYFDSASFLRQLGLLE
jgi:steroid delta-isomerase-like uncharacterized protein